tara:strand:+ start:1529 stop:3148 length:1620 start_codon:yes stop_codon:yes gene_type:complete
MSFLEGLLNVGKEVVTHADDIAYGALSEQYNKMVSDTQDRHRRFTAWGDEVQTDINGRKKNLQLEEDNYNKLIAKLKSRTDADIDKHLLSKNLTIDEYLAPLSGQLGTGMFLGEEQTILPKVKSFLDQVGIQKGNPYVPSEVYFEKNKEKLDTQMQDISGMGYNTWRALTKKGELSMMTDTKAVEFTEQDKMKAIHEIGISLKTFDLWYEANTPQQETMAMFSKYLLIKKEAADKATRGGKDIGSALFNISARTYENEMIASEGINLSHIGGLFPGVDENTIRSIGIQGNAALNIASSIVAEISGLNPSDKDYELKKQELINRANGYMTQAVNFALETDQRFKAAAMGKGEYDVSDVQKRVVRKIKTTLPEKAKEIFSEMTKAWDGRDSNAQFNSHNDTEGQGKINYAYTKVGRNGIKTWFLIDSNGVEIQTNLTYNNIRPDTEGGMAAVYEAIFDDIRDQIQTGRVKYTDKVWVRQVANNLGYQIDNETGRVISVNEKSIDKPEGALYHGFRDKPISLPGVKKEETDIGIFDDTAISP